jgi:hypothetical protein
MRAFSSLFTQVRAAAQNEAWFETTPERGRKRGVNTAISRLGDSIRALGAAPILTGEGYRVYLPVVAPRNRLPSLAAGYAAVFFLGSVTRYRPDVFGKLVSGGYAWVVEEFLSTYPLQFIYALASELAGVDVVRPYAALE